MAAWDDSVRINKIENLIRNKKNLEDAICQFDRIYNNWDSDASFVVKKPFPFIIGSGINIDFSNFNLSVRNEMVNSFRKVLSAEKNRIEDEIVKLMNGDTNGR